VNTPRATRYLFVCTANINRSPTAATWAERHLADRFVSAEIRSAGVAAWSGAEASAYAIDVMRELGMDMRDHRSTPISAELLHWADHIVVMEPGHAEYIESMLPEAQPRIIGLWTYLDGGPEHVPDPHRQGIDVFRDSCNSLGAAVETLIDQHLAARRAARRLEASST